MFWRISVRVLQLPIDRLETRRKEAEARSSQGPGGTEVASVEAEKGGQATRRITETATATATARETAACRERLVQHGALLTAIGRSYGVSQMR